MAQKQRDPQEQIQKPQGAKKQFFWFSLGVLHGFSRKSNEDEFSRKSNGDGFSGVAKNNNNNNMIRLVPAWIESGRGK